VRIDDTARSGYTTLRTAIDAADEGAVEELLRRFVSTSTSLRRVGQLVRGRLSICAGGCGGLTEEGAHARPYHP
jgi:hypothetical protein